MLINHISSENTFWILNWAYWRLSTYLKAYFLSSGQICTFGLDYECEGCLSACLMRPFLSRFQSEKDLRSAIADDHLVQFNCCLCPSHPRYIQKRVNTPGGGELLQGWGYFTVCCRGVHLHPVVLAYSTHRVKVVLDFWGVSGAGTLETHNPGHRSGVPLTDSDTGCLYLHRYPPNLLYNLHLPSTYKETEDKIRR